MFGFSSLLSFTSISGSAVDIAIMSSTSSPRSSDSSSTAPPSIPTSSSPSAAPPPFPPSQWRLPSIYLSGALLRLFLFLYTPSFPESLMDRLELSTPLTSFRRRKSALRYFLEIAEKALWLIWLLVFDSQRRSLPLLAWSRPLRRRPLQSRPYLLLGLSLCSLIALITHLSLHTSGRVHLQSPLHLLLSRAILPPSSPLIIALGYTLADLASAWLLKRIWDARIEAGKGTEIDQGREGRKGRDWSEMVVFLFVSLLLHPSGSL